MQKIILALLIITRPLTPIELQADVIYQAIQQKLTFESYAQRASLSEFLQSQEAECYIQSIYALDPRVKCQIMDKIYGTLSRVLPEDAIWQARRNYIAATIKTGGDINAWLPRRSSTDYHRTTFLGHATVRSDYEAVEFAIHYHANTAVEDPIHSPDTHYPLGYARTRAIAQLLLQNGAGIPLYNKPKRLFRTLYRMLLDDCEPQVLQLFKEHGFDLCVRNNLSTLLHQLCLGATLPLNYDKAAFVAKFNILIGAGVDWRARDTQGRTALKYISEALEEIVGDFPMRLFLQPERKPEVMAILLEAKSLLEALASND